MPRSGSPSAARTAGAVWFPRSRAVELREEPLPDLGPLDVRVQAIASGLSHGTEMLVYRGEVPVELELDLPTLRGSFDFPIKYGYASVGRIVELGAKVEMLSAGDLVFVHHPHQSDYVVPESTPIRLPNGTDPEAGIFVANLETAVNVVLDAAPRLGERAIVFGQGVIGLLVTQLLRRSGAAIVLAVDPIARRRDLALRVGADAAAPPEEARALVRRFTDRLGVDIAVEASGNGEALQAAVDCAAPEGTVVVASWYGTKRVSLSLGAEFHRRRLHIRSSQVSNLDPALAPRWDRGRRRAVAIALLPDLELGSLVSHRFPFARAAEAYRLVDEHPEDTVQVVLRYDSV